MYNYKPAPPNSEIAETDSVAHKKSPQPYRCSSRQGKRLHHSDTCRTHHRQLHIFQHVR